MSMRLQRELNQLQKAMLERIAELEARIAALEKVRKIKK
jgi:hypothetical protein